jgi:CDP-diacylglycerol--serine O-phosphatidyltransferase
VNDQRLENGPFSSVAPRRRRGFRPVPLRLLLPNIVTLIALCLGMTAIRLAMEGSIEWAVSAIAGAAVLDALDGRIARALKGTSRFGAELDSLADFVDFGVAPAFVLFTADLHVVKSFGWVAALLFAMACALRLARFNVMLDDPDQPMWRKNFFVGMPAPAGAIVGLLPIYLRFGFDLSAPPPGVAVFESLYVMAIALLMASRVPHFSGKSIGRVPREHLAVFLVGVAAALLLVFVFPMQSLVAVTLAYLASIPFAIRRYRELDRAGEAGARHDAKSG